jgi:urate oxidase
MTIALAHHRYGKSNVRLVKLTRTAGRHGIVELTVSIRLQGDFEAAHTEGDNTQVLPTDTMKNTVYALAQDHPIDAIESFALRLGDHFVCGHESVSAAEVSISATHWRRLLVGGESHPHAFERGSDERMTCRVHVQREAAAVESGIVGLVIMKTSDSGFEGYRVDELTTLAPTADRILCTSLSAQWKHAGLSDEWVTHREGIRRVLVETFANHRSRSVQHTLYAMAHQVLQAYGDITSIHLSMPNKHCLLVDLAPFGRTNDNEIFLPIDEPHGLIEARVERRESVAGAVFDDASE